MTIQEKYDAFVEEYWNNIETLKKESRPDNAASRIADLFIQFAAPLTKKEWLNLELKEATANEDYEYCSQLKTELEKL